MAGSEVAWQAPEFEYREKDVSWHWMSVIAAVLVLSAAVWQKNFLFAAFIIPAEILVLVWASRKPHMFQFALNEKGLAVGDGKFYPYADMESFAVGESPEDEWADLVCRFKKSLRPALKIKAPMPLLPQIEKLLGSSVKRIEFEESLLEALERFVGF